MFREVLYDLIDNKICNLTLKLDRVPLLHVYLSSKAVDPLSFGY
jgi:hypothetical protein